MNRVGSLVLKSLVLLTIANLNFVNAQTQKAPQPVPQVGERMDSRTYSLIDLPQLFVVCTGWHALCTASPDCQHNGIDKASCDCMRVKEQHIVLATTIQDIAVKRLTQARCTRQHPCDVDEAPVCKAIKYGQYKVDNVKYRWVSTYSYRGWCTLLQQELKACYPGTSGYTGDSSWAVCDAAPCTESQHPSDPNRPLSCQCMIETTAFVGLNGSCTGNNGGIMSSMPVGTWDFQNNTYTFPMPGYEYVQGACAPLKSDPLPMRQSGNPY